MAKVELNGTKIFLRLSFWVKRDLHPVSRIAGPIIASRCLDLNWHSSAKVISSQNVKCGNIARERCRYQASLSELSTHQILAYLSR